MSAEVTEGQWGSSEVKRCVLTACLPAGMQLGEIYRVLHAPRYRGGCEAGTEIFREGLVKVQPQPD